jgi:hypothetical protein
MVEDIAVVIVMGEDIIHKVMAEEDIIHTVMVGDTIIIHIREMSDHQLSSVA